MLEQVLVNCMGVWAGLYAGWRLAPASLRRRISGLVPARWRAARPDRSGVSSGCSSCDSCSACRAPRPSDRAPARPVFWQATKAAQLSFEGQQHNACGNHQNTRPIPQ